MWKLNKDRKLYLCVCVFETQNVIVCSHIYTCIFPSGSCTIVTCISCVHIRE